GLEGNHDLSGLGCLASRAHAQMEVRTLNLQVLEEDVGHVLVVVLARMDEHGPYLGNMGHFAQQGRDFHEIRPGSYDAENLQRDGSLVIADRSLSRKHYLSG